MIVSLSISVSAGIDTCSGSGVRLQNEVHPAMLDSLLPGDCMPSAVLIRVFGCPEFNLPSYSLSNGIAALYPFKD